MVGAEQRGSIFRLTLQNPPANLLSAAVMEALREELERAREDDNVDGIIIGAAGKLFSAGHDLKEMAAHRVDPDQGRSFFEQSFEVCSWLMQAIVRHPKPVIAEIDGIATAAGWQLVASCDLAIASDRSKFGVNGIDVGLFCSAPAVALTRNVHFKHAMEMLLTGEMIDAQRALEFGLVNRIAPYDRLKDAVNGLAATIAAKSSHAVRLGKKSVTSQAGLGLAAAYHRASKVMVENMMTGDAQEGISAFLEKRQPSRRR